MRETADGIYFGNLFGFPLFAHRSLVAIAPTLGFLVLAAGSTGDLIDRIFALCFLLASVLAHELAHAFAARATGVPVTHIALTWFGGYAEFPMRPARRWQEILIAVAGPLANLLIGGSALLAASLLFTNTGRTWSEGGNLYFSPSDPTLAERALRSLGWMNASLGVFNLLPGLPLDGGHVLRSILSTIIPSRGAHAIAAFAGFLIGIGVTANAIRVESPWMLVIGVFLMGAALHESLRA